MQSETSNGATEGLGLIERVITAAVAVRASDIDIQPDGNWSLTVDGDEVRQPEKLPDQAPSRMIDALNEHGSPSVKLALRRAAKFFEVHNCHTAADFAHEAAGQYVRVHADHRCGYWGVNFRLINTVIPSLLSLGIPTALVRTIVDAENGIIVVSGATGSGKSSTLASALQYYLNNEQGKVVTYESPIEFPLKSGVGTVIQKEIGLDCPSYIEATESAMRENAGIIMLGEMRDPPTILSALRLGATGHMLISTIHADTALGTIERIIEAAPDADRAFYRGLLASKLRLILCQRLVKKKGGGRRALHEVLVVTPTVRAIMSNPSDTRLNGLYDAIMTGSLEGMMTFAQCAAKAVANGEVDEQVACNLTAVSKDEWAKEMKNAREKHAKEVAAQGKPVPMIQTPTVVGRKF